MHDYILEGMGDEHVGDEHFGNYDLITFSKEDPLLVQESNDLVEDYEAVIFYEDDQGATDVEYYTSADHARNIWADIEEEYSVYLGEVEEANPAMDDYEEDDMGSYY